MKHHFTNSERLAILVYRILREGGVVNFDYTDMISEEIRTLNEPWQMPGWGIVKKPIEKTITFVCDNPFIVGAKRIEVVLRGGENNDGSKAWRLYEVKQISKGEEDYPHTISVPPLSQIQQELKRIKAQLKRYETLEKLERLVSHTTFISALES